MPRFSTLPVLVSLFLFATVSLATVCTRAQLEDDLVHVDCSPAPRVATTVPVYRLGRRQGLRILVSDTTTHSAVDGPSNRPFPADWTLDPNGIDEAAEGQMDVTLDIISSHAPACGGNLPGESLVKMAITTPRDLTTGALQAAKDQLALTTQDWPVPPAVAFYSTAELSLEVKLAYKEVVLFGGVNGFDYKLAQQLASKHSCEIPFQGLSSASVTDETGISTGVLFWNQIITKGITGEGDDTAAQSTSALARMLSVIEAGGGNRSNIVRVTVYLRTGASESDFYSAWSSFWSGTAYRPALHLITNVYLLRDAVTPSLLTPVDWVQVVGEAELCFGDHDCPVARSTPFVWQRPTIESQVVQGPSGWAYTSELFGTTNFRQTSPVVLTNGSAWHWDPTRFPAYLALALPPYSITTQKVREAAQCLLNVQRVLTATGLDLADVAYLDHSMGPSGDFSAIFSDWTASMIVFNGTEARPARTDHQLVGMPSAISALGGRYGVTALAYESGDHTYPSTGEVYIPTPATNIVELLICAKGQTDNPICPKYLRADQNSDCTSGACVASVEVETAGR